MNRKTLALAGEPAVRRRRGPGGRLGRRRRRRAPPAPLPPDRGRERADRDPAQARASLRRHRDGHAGPRRREPERHAEAQQADRGHPPRAHPHRTVQRRADGDNPRIWANLTEVIKGTSETMVNVVTLKELQSEPSSINVHDPTHAYRALVCGDIPRAG